MKKIISFIIAILFPLLVIGQNRDVVGNSTVGEFVQKANFKSNFVAGFQCTLKQEVILTGIGMIGKGTGAEVKLAIYSDVNGEPNELIVFTQKAKVLNGEMNLKVSPTKLKAGDYWIMGVGYANKSCSIS